MVLFGWVRGSFGLKPSAAARPVSVVVRSVVEGCGGVSDRIRICLYCMSHVTNMNASRRTFECTVSRVDIGS